MKNNIWAILAMILVMFGLPGGTVAFAPHDAGMAIAFILFFGLNLFFHYASHPSCLQEYFLPGTPFSA